MALFGVGVAMAKSIVTEAELRRTHRVLRIATPFEAMSELLRAAVAAATRAIAAQDARRSGAPSVDLKRRAAGDMEE